jgi:predicted nucleic acid-binding protein
VSLILADTSVWTDHLRTNDPLMIQLVAEERLLMHPYVVGELSMGILPDRMTFIRRLRQMDFAMRASDTEVSRLVEDNRLYGTGIGWVDAHLLASALLTEEVKLWTRDRRLNDAAARFDRAALLHH